MIARRYRWIPAALTAIVALLGMPASALSAPADISAASGTDTPRIVVDGRGAAHAVWRNNTGIRYATRPANGTWSAAQGISPSAQNPEIAVDGNGVVHVVWRFTGGADVVQAVTRATDGTWSAPTTLSAGGSNVFLPHVAVTEDGVAHAIWTRITNGFQIVQVATRGTDGTWSAPADISAAGFNAYDPRILASSTGEVHAVWRRIAGSALAETATRAVDGTWSAPVTLSAPGQHAFPAKIVADGSGTVHVVWRRSDGANDRVQSVTRAPDGSWSAPTDLSAAGSHASDPQIAISPSGDAYVVWTRSTFVQAATRAPAGAWSAPIDISAAGSSSREPQVAVDGYGAVHVVWIRASKNITHALMRDGAWSAPTDVSATAPGAATMTVPQVAANADGVAHALWVQASMFGAPTPVLQGEMVASPPTVTAVAAGPDVINGALQPLELEVQFSSPVTVDTTGGVPSFDTLIGAATRAATYVSGSGTATLRFRAMPLAGDMDDDAISLGSSIDLNGSTMAGTDGPAIRRLADVPALDVLVDTVGPTVASITRVGTPAASAGSVEFLVSFSEPVVGVDAQDMALTTTGTATAAVVGVTGSGAQRTVQVGSITGAGTIRVDLDAAGTGIADAAGNAITGGFAQGATHTVAPVVAPTGPTQDPVTGPTQVTGSSRLDRLTGTAGDDVVQGFAGNDTLVASAGNDRLEGGTGIDTLALSACAGATVNLAKGTLTGCGGVTTLVSIERVVGSPGNDHITGTASANQLCGGAGNDRIDGGGGNDLVCGGVGNDTLIGGAGNDVLIGGAGTDRLHGQSGRDRLFGNAGDDLLRGGLGNDLLSGDAGRDRLTGDAGNDRLLGGTGNDTLHGGTGRDHLAGGRGVDRLVGGAGRDRLVH